MLSGIESCWPALEHVLNMRTNRDIVQGTDPVRCSSSVLTISFESHNQLSIAKDWNVRIVSTRDYLTLSFQSSKVGNDAIIHESIVQIVLGLVDHERSVRSAEQEKEQCGRALSFRQIIHFLVLPLARARLNVEPNLDRFPNRAFLKLPKERLSGLKQRPRLRTADGELGAQFSFSITRRLHERSS